MSRLLAPACVIALLLALTAGAGDWPQWRGPNRDDVSAEKGLLQSWPRGGPKLIWKGTGIGQGYSTVSVVGDKIFTMGDKGGASHVFALSKSNGKLLWSARVGKPGGNYAGTRCTPTVDGQLLYAIGQFGDLVCFETDKGNERWRKNFKSDFKGNPGHWNFSESPLIDGDKLVCTPGGRDASMVALDKLTGEVVWKCPLDSTAGYSSIVVSEAGGIRQYVQLTARGVFGVSAKDGKKLWYYPRWSGNTANVPTPIVKSDQVFVSAGYGTGGALLTLKAAKGGIEVKEEYFNRRLTNKHGGVVIVGNYAYGDTDASGRPFCAEWKTGEVKWQRNPRDDGGRGSASASMTYADGHLYVRYENGWVALVEASPDGYKEHGTFRIPNTNGPSWAHPVVSNSRLYLREKDVLWCYDVKAK
jgi:outer membrane protein assembly factor BamB